VWELTFCGFLPFFGLPFLGLPFLPFFTYFDLRGKIKTFGKKLYKFVAFFFAFFFGPNAFFPFFLKVAFLI
jgi:hypothetical protein